MTPVAEDPLYRAAKAAEYLGVHVNTLRWWRRHGRGPAFVMHGSHHLYHLSALEVFHEQGDGESEGAA